MSHIRYFFYVFWHKWYILKYRKVCVVSLWRALVHDLSKYSRAEWPHYVRRFYKGGHEDDVHWHHAVLHHYNHNRHHWQYWVDDKVPRVIPETYLREMILDWIAFGAQRGRIDFFSYYKRNRYEINLERDTRHKLEVLLDKVATDVRITKE